MCKIFKDKSLNITIETNFHSTVYLDENNSLQYIRKQRSHPSLIIKQIPSMISKRLSDITSDKEHFDKAAPIYNKALKNNSFNETLKFSPTIPTRNHRRRNIICFNLPFSSDVKTNVRQLFLTPLQKHFLRHHKYYKLFNKNKVKISCSCMLNMESVAQNQNANLLSNHTTPVRERSCSSRQKSECPLNNECLSESLVYIAVVSQTLSQINKYYYETCEKTFKERYNNHTATFRNKSKQKLRNSLKMSGN